MAKVHDRGGWPTNEPIDMTEHELADWEWDTYTLLGLLVSKGVMTTDELRRGIEALSADEYESLNSPRTRSTRRSPNWSNGGGSVWTGKLRDTGPATR